MVKLYRELNSAKADAIEAELKDMIFGYDRVIVDSAQASELFGGKRSLPVITNNEKIVSGEEIAPYLVELKKLMHDWQAFQGDSCYVDDNGKVC